MTTLTLDGYIVKEKTDDGKMYFYSAMPEYTGDEFCCKNPSDLCFDIVLPIKEFLSADNPQRCKITIELEK
jgi:hypothetical protein